MSTAELVTRGPICSSQALQGLNSSVNCRYLSWDKTDPVLGVTPVFVWRSLEGDLCYGHSYCRNYGTPGSVRGGFLAEMP